MFVAHSESRDVYGGSWRRATLPGMSMCPVEFAVRPQGSADPLLLHVLLLAVGWGSPGGHQALGTGTMQVQRGARVFSFLLCFYGSPLDEEWICKLPDRHI